VVVYCNLYVYVELCDEEITCVHVLGVYINYPLYSSLVAWGCYQTS